MKNYTDHGKASVSIENFGIQGEATLKVWDSEQEKYWMLTNLTCESALPAREDLELIITTSKNTVYKTTAQYHDQNRRIFSYGKLKQLELDVLA